VALVTNSYGQGIVAGFESPDGKLRSDFRCAGCGYGVAVAASLPTACPMCGGASWDRAAVWRAPAESLAASSAAPQASGRRT
jgi:hypothetical protein